MTDITKGCFDTFGVGKQELDTLITEGLRSGGDWCDLYFENTFYSELVLRDSQVSSGSRHIDYGCGVRVLSGEKTGYAYSEATDLKSLIGAARAASGIASGTSTAGPARTGGASCGKCRTGGFTRTQPASGVGASYYNAAIDCRNCSSEEFLPLLEGIDKALRERESHTVKVIAVMSESTSEIMMYNSLGELSTDLRPMASLTVSAVFRKGERSKNLSSTRSMRMGAEFFSKEIADEMVDEILSGVDRAFEARRPKGGSMPVVMAAGASGILLHEAMGHAFEADFNRKGQSIFTGKIGQRICRSGIDIVDDATVPFCRGSINTDDEGVPGQKTYMVRDGILTSYLHDRISARWFGVSPTGNGRRESFRYNPIPRMRTTYMENGPDGSASDIVASVKKGIYVDQFSNGQVKIGEGDFTFFVKSGYLIENGVLTMPVGDINIIGNGPRALADISMVASDLKIDPGRWTCGKGQSVAVSCGIPTVLVNNLTVGGE